MQVLIRLKFIVNSMNESEYLAFVSSFTYKIFRFSKCFLVSREEVEDAKQDVLLKLWKSRQVLSDYNNPEAFAMTITKNLKFL